MDAQTPGRGTELTRAFVAWRHAPARSHAGRAIGSPWGNLSLLVVGLIVTGLLFWRSRPVLSGLLLGLSVVVKPLGPWPSWCSAPTVPRRVKQKVEGAFEVTPRRHRSLNVLTLGACHCVQDRGFVW